MRGLGILGEWEIDGTLGWLLLLFTIFAALAYVVAAQVGRRRDRRHRRWPLKRTAFFVSGLVLLSIVLDSGLGAAADDRLSAHMVEHMAIWLAVAPLLVAGAPLRLAFFSLGRVGRRRLGGALRSRGLSALTSPAVSTGIFSAVVVATCLPAVYAVTIEDDLVHLAEHVVYLLTAMLVWSPLIRADPLPHRLGPTGRCLCVVSCMVPMAAIAVWLLVAGSPVYGSVAESGAGALHDQRIAGLIMLGAALPALAIGLGAPALAGSLTHRHLLEGRGDDGAPTEARI